MICKRIIAIGMALSMFLGMSIMGRATEESEIDALIQEKAVAQLEKGWGLHYDFLDYSATLCGSHTNNGVTEKVFLLEISAMLKAEDVYDLPYFQGVMESYESNIIASDSKNINLTLHEQKNELLAEEIKGIYDNLTQYIGAEQIFPFYLKATYSESDLDTLTLLFDNGIEYVPAEGTFPVDSDILKQQGYTNVNHISDSLEQKIDVASMGAKSINYTYSVYDAVMYISKYTSNPTSCNVCNGTCTAQVDTTKYNSAYPAHVGIGYHNDCANYVSQALYAGGIPQDSEWKPNSDAWKQVSTLSDYMIEQGYWETVTYSDLQVGDYIRFTSGSHIVMITAHDGTTYRYSGHTNDKLHYAISLDSNSNCIYYSVK